MFWPVLTSPNLNSMRWLGLFTNKTFRKHLKLIFPHWDFIICIVSLAIVHPHFDILIFPSAFYHPHFIIRIFPSAFYHPHFIIRILSPAIHRHLVCTLQRPRPMPLCKRQPLHGTLAFEWFSFSRNRCIYDGHDRNRDTELIFIAI